MKHLRTILAKHSGRDARGHISVRHQGGRMKRFLRNIDFKRERMEVSGTVKAIEYDPNRNARIALVVYDDGSRGYILSPLGLALGSRIIASENAAIEIGNSLPLVKIPIGTQIHNLEVKPGRGGQIVKSAGSVAVVQGKEKDYVLVKLPSGEVKKFDGLCWASIGQVGNIAARTVVIGTAGRKRRMGIRPSVRGVAMHPHAHPHGGGEGRSGIGMKFPKTVYGKKAVGKTRKRRKYSDFRIVQGRKKGPHVG